MISEEYVNHRGTKAQRRGPTEDTEFSATKNPASPRLDRAQHGKHEMVVNHRETEAQGTGD